MRWVRLAVLGITLAACASGPKRPEWTPGPDRPAGGAPLARDHYECQRENAYHYLGVGAWSGPLSEQIKVDQDLYRACMRARGWVHRDD